MPDVGLRAEIRKALRDYDNPKSGRNINYHNPHYMNSLIVEYGMTEAELREYATSRKNRNNK